VGNPNKRVVIIGGGIIGAMAAYFLHQKRWSVTIVEKDRFGCGASHGNCGLVVPSHESPLNSFSNLISGIGWMFKKDAPLFIKHRTDPAWIRWILQFIRHCADRQRQIAAAGRAALMANTIAMYETLIQTEGIDCHWDTSGTLHLFHDKRDWSAYGANQSRADFMKPLRRDDLCALLPSIAPGVVGAWHDPGAAMLRPDALMSGLSGALKRNGVNIIEQTRCIGLKRKQGRAAAVQTDRGEFPAEAVVLSTGAWTSRLSKALGCRIPIQPGKGYSVTLPRIANSPALPCFFEETRVVMTPWSDGLRLGGTMEFSGFDDTLNPFRIATLFGALKKYLPLSLPPQIEEEWCGWRPMTWDGLPMIDHLPGTRNVILAAGHNELGLTMAPATGRLVAEMTSKEVPHVDPFAYRIGRR